MKISTALHLWGKLMRVKLGEVCERGSSNLMQKDVTGCAGDYPIYGASGQIGFVDFYHQERPYVAVVKDGAGIGRTMLLPAKSSVIGTMQYLLPKENVLPDYLCYVVQYMHLEKYFSGATIPHIYFRDYKDEEFDLSSLDEQAGIVKTLNGVVDVIEKRRQQLSNLDVLIKARFVEMFGDPISNPKGWDSVGLLELGSCKSGMNFHTDDAGVEVHCLGVGDFKDKSVISDTSVLPLVSLNEMPLGEYLLQDGDIVFVRSNGNKALVGRCLAVFPGQIQTTFSGFCIRFRKRSHKVTTEYLIHVLKTESMRKKMQGRGANIQNLNQQILGSLSIPVPPVDMQNRFSECVYQVDKSKAVVQAAHVIERNLHSRRQQKCRILNF